MEWKNRWSCTNNGYKKILTGTSFLLAPATNHSWYKPIFYCLHEMAACCDFEVNLGNWLDHYLLSRLTDGTPHSFSDLLYFTLLLPFTWTNYSKSNSLSPFCFSAQNFLSPISLPSSLRTKKFWVKNILSPTSIPQKCSKTVPNFVLLAKSFQFRKNILSPISSPT